MQAAHDVLAGESKAGLLRRLLPFFGPAFIASVAYMDPGNFATNIQGGSQFGYELVWVIVASNLMAMLLQTLSAKLGIAAGMNLAELCRQHFPKPVVWFLWALMELVAMATDLAEFLGAALGFYLLFGMPLGAAAIATGIATFLLLGLERRGFRPFEAVITILVAVVAACYLVEIFLARPSPYKIATGLMPHFSNTESILLATGILGATVMPHAVLLHSALTQSRIRVKNPQQMRRLFNYEILDVVVAMGVAGLVNAAMLIMAAKTFYETGRTDVGSIETAHQTLPVLGPVASMVFAVSLLASGLSSAAVGTMAGQVIMQGFIHRHIPLWLRRGLTMLPSFVVIFAGLDPTRTLVISQVVLSFGLPFVIVPLIYFTRRKDIMGTLVNKPVTTGLACIVGLLVIALNLYLLADTFRKFFGG
ncbi:MAG: Nramp family divalent metal transporter [Bacillota bacterium]